MQGEGREPAGELEPWRFRCLSLAGLQHSSLEAMYEIGSPERSVTWLTEEVLGNVESLRAVTAEVLRALCSEERNWELLGLLAVLKV